MFQVKFLARLCCVLGLHTLLLYFSQCTWLPENFKGELTNCIREGILNLFQGNETCESLVEMGHLGSRLDKHTVTFDNCSTPSPVSITSPAISAPEQTRYTIMIKKLERNFMYLQLSKACSSYNSLIPSTITSNFPIISSNIKKGWVPTLEWGRYQFWNGVGTNIVMGWLPILNGVGANIGMEWVPMLGWGGYQYQDGVEKETKLRKAINRNVVTEELSYQEPNNKQVSQTIWFGNFVTYTTLRLRYMGKKILGGDNKGLM